MKIGIFTDSHYSSAIVTCGNRYNSQSLDKIREMYRVFEKEGCELVCCLGDLIDHDSDHLTEISNLRQIAQVLKTALDSERKLQTICLMGNHDAFSFTEEEFYNILGDACRPRIICKEGKTLIFLDTCYFKTGVHYQPGDSDWTDTFLPEPEVLARKIEEAPGEVYVFLHQNIDPEIREDHRLFNDEIVRRIIASSGKVKVVYQGHYHRGNQCEKDGVKYVTFPAVCENKEAYFILEI